MTKHHSHDIAFKPESIHELRAMVQGIHASIGQTIDDEWVIDPEPRPVCALVRNHKQGRYEAFKDVLDLIDQTIEAQQAKAKRSPLKAWLSKWLHM